MYLKKLQFVQLEVEVADRTGMARSRSMHRPKLLDFMDWSERAEKLGFRLHSYGSSYGLRREADGELMTPDLSWEQMMALIKQLEGSDES